MKLIRWVEVHIGRSRRKAKKDKDGSEGKLTMNVGPDVPRRRDESNPSTPLHKVEPIGNDLLLPRSAGNTPRRIKHPPSPHASIGAPATPLSVRIRSSHGIQQPQYIRANTFQEPSPHPSPGGMSSVDSPRQRSRIRTNPWLPSPRSSGETGWGRRRASSSIGSESLESVSGSGFGSQSSGSVWDEPWSAFRGAGRSPLVNPRLPRVTLERSAVRKPSPAVSEDRPYCPATYCRPIPRSAWMDFREVSTSLAAADESSDEAYSEDYAEDDENSDGQEDRLPRAEAAPDTGSPQADSACGSDRDNSSSCSTTPLSETATATRRPSITKENRELLQDKVQRLRAERHLVDRRMREARVEEIARREEQIVLRRELVQFRRLLLLQTLSELRDQLERRYENPSPANADTSWLHSELV